MVADNLSHEREPQAELLVCGPFPAHESEHPVRRELDEVHRGIASLDELEHVRVLDLRALFLDGDGVPNDRMRADRVHISEAGQAAWMEALEPTLAALFDKPR